ncbi:MAG: nickel-dependent lactate racemase [Deltaproteobacteria bacterium]
MHVSFSYPDVPALETPDSCEAVVLSPLAAGPLQPAEALAEEALVRPTGHAPIENYVLSSTRILILVDDITRQTPAAAILPPLLRRLASRGARSKNVRFLIAAGTHSRMSAAEIEKKLGAEIPRNYSVTLHHWKDEGQLVQIGTAEDGTPIRVNRMLKESDLVIGVGQIVPHRVMGFTGGATIVQPGVSGKEITGYTHWRSALFAGEEILGRAENPVRKEVERMAALAGLKFILNVVMDAEFNVLHVVAGDPVAAHRRGAHLSSQIYGVPLAAPADIVITESYPADYDLWQAAKGIYAAELAVKPGGMVIIVTPCPHGVSEEHQEVERLGYRGFTEVKALVDEKQITDLVAAAHLVHVGRVIRDKARGIMVSPGIQPDVQRHLGFEPARTPQEAFEKALSLTGPNATVAVLRHGGDVLPVVNQKL